MKYEVHAFRVYKTYMCGEVQTEFFKQEIGTYNTLEGAIEAACNYDNNTYMDDEGLNHNARIVTKFTNTFNIGEETVKYLYAIEYELIPLPYGYCGVYVTKTDD